ncbi:hypothetical protein J6590_013563 [Homalodisca vitripennis]|nr:hypothetical protein J6590_013563 [Homalodisca vitripennis]
MAAVQDAVITNGYDEVKINGHDYEDIDSQEDDVQEDNDKQEINGKQEENGKREEYGKQEENEFEKIPQKEPLSAKIIPHKICLKVQIIGFV